MDVAILKTNQFLDQYLLGTEPQEQYHWAREFVVGYWVFVIGAQILYALCSGGLFYYRVVLHKDYYYPGWKGPSRESVVREVKHSTSSIFGFALLTMPLTYLEHHAPFSKMYFDITEHSLLYTVGTILGVLAFSDMAIYWIHRWLHHPLLYARFHKPHHAYKLVTPFASHAFHPVDGWAQSLPYHIYPFLFPINNWVHLIFLTIVNVWTVNIHDQIGMIDAYGILNGGGHHDIHHREFNYNYGQYTTFWDRLGGSYKPTSFFTPKEEEKKTN